MSSPRITRRGGSCIRDPWSRWRRPSAGREAATTAATPATAMAALLDVCMVLACEIASQEARGNQPANGGCTAGLAKVCGRGGELLDEGA